VHVNFFRRAVRRRGCIEEDATYSPGLFDRPDYGGLVIKLCVVHCLGE